MNPTHIVISFSQIIPIQVSAMAGEDVQSLVDAENPAAELKRLPKGLYHTIDFMLSTLIKFPSIPSKVEEAVLGRICEVLTFSVREMDSSVTLKKGLKKCLISIMDHKRTRRKIKP